MSILCVPQPTQPSSSFFLEARDRVSIPSLLNPRASFDATAYGVPSNVSQIPETSHYQEGHNVQANGYQLRNRVREDRRSYRNSPYPLQPARKRRRSPSPHSLDFATSELERPVRRSSKRARISRHAEQAPKDLLELEAARFKVEWTREQAAKVESPRPAQRSVLDNRSLAQWLAEYMWDTLSLEGQTDNKTGFLKELRAELRAVLNSCINPFNSMVFLALLYMRKLLGHDRLDLHGYSDRHRARVIFRAFCVALILAFKWLDDFTISFAERTPESFEDFWRKKHANPKKYRTCWAEFMSMSVEEAKDTEVAALGVLNWNISVSTSDWSDWLRELYSHASSCTSGSSASGFATAAALICGAWEELESNAPTTPCSWGKADSVSSEASRRFQLALFVGLPQPHILPASLDLFVTSSSGYTAELRCSEDPIVCRPVKVIGNAPGHTWSAYSSSEPITELGLVASSLPQSYPESSHGHCHQQCLHVECRRTSTPISLTPLYVVDGLPRTPYHLNI